MDKGVLLAEEWALIWNPKKGFSMLVPEKGDESGDMPRQGLALLKIFSMLKDDEFVSELAQAALDDLPKQEPE